METFYFFGAIVLIIGGVVYLAYKQDQKRRAEFEKIAMANGDMYHNKQSKLFYDRIADRGYKLFSIGHSRRVTHLFETPFDGGWMAVFEYKYTTGSGKHSSTHQYHAAVIESDKLPAVQFSIKRERLIHQIKPKLGLTTKDIDFEMYPDFSERFFLEGDDEAAVRSAFSEDVINWFENMTTPYDVAMQYGGLVMYAKGKLRPETIEILKRDGKTLHDRLVRSTKASKFDTDFSDDDEWWG